MPYQEYRTKNEIIAPDESEVIASVNNSDRVTIDFDVENVVHVEDINIISNIDDCVLPTLEEIRQASRNCPDLGPMFVYLERGALPNDDNVARKIVFKSQEYVLRDGVLYHL